MRPIFLQNSVEVHPELSNNGHPLDATLVVAGSLWPFWLGMTNDFAQTS
jgi:hypothetical protein